MERLIIGFCTPAPRAASLIVPLFIGLMLVLGAPPAAAQTTWTSPASLATARQHHTTTLLPDGRIVLAGGSNGLSPLASIEIFDPATGTSAAAPVSLSDARAHHTATLLPDNRILFAGGAGTSGTIGTAEVLDVSSWAIANVPLQQARSHHTATALGDGRVLLVGGRHQGASIASLEIFDPQTLASEALGITLADARQGHTATLVRGDRVLIAGGVRTGMPLRTTEIFDNGVIRPGPSLMVERFQHAAVATRSGAVLLIGGIEGDTIYHDSVELYWPDDDSIVTVGGKLAAARYGSSAVSLPDNGGVLIVGGIGADGAVAAIDYFNPVTLSLISMPPMPGVRGHSQVVAAGGRVWVLGGMGADLMPTADVSTAEYPTVATEHPDYPPNTTVHLGGTGWRAGETVSIEITRVGQDGLTVLQVVADAQGTFETHDFATGPDDSGVTFIMVARGDSSGSIAKGQFYDSHFMTSLSASTLNNSTAQTLVINGGNFTINSAYNHQVLASGPTGTAVLPIQSITNSAITVTVPNGLSAGNYGIRVRVTQVFAITEAYQVCQTCVFYHQHCGTWSCSTHEHYYSCNCYTAYRTVYTTNTHDAGPLSLTVVNESDNDGVPDDADNCPGASNPDQADADDDGIGDACDACPNDAQNDADGDDVCGNNDNCPDAANASQADADLDGAGDACDACPQDAQNDTDGDGVCGNVDNCPLTANDQTDADGDALGDACDACATDPDNDADGDGLCANVDNCPDNANAAQADADADGQGDVCDPDDDGDGVADAADNCPLLANADQTNTDGDVQGNACDPDDDNDAVSDASDNCPLAANAGQTDTDADAQGDACDADDDNDTVLDLSDNCALTANTDQTNTDADAQGDACDADDDNDTVLDLTDNCALTANTDQTNTDADAQGDACDADDDNDTVLDPSDNCALTANADQTNTDGDAQGDACDADDDNDTVLDASDNCALNANADQTNTDGDAEGDACDTDDDNDAIIDGHDNCPLAANANQADNDADMQGDVCDPDDDNDGVADGSDNCAFVSNGNQTNTDGDAEGDACDADDDGDGLADTADNCQWVSNPAQENFDGDPLGDACDLRNAPKFTGAALSAPAINEGGTVTLSGAFADPDAGQSHLLLVNWGDGTSSTVTVAPGVFTFSVAHQYDEDSPSGTPSDSYAISFTVTDPDTDSAAAQTSVIVNNLSPTVTSVGGPAGPVALGSLATVSANIQDAGILDTHSCSFDWDDGTTTSGPASAGACSATHEYAQAGVYTVEVAVTDDDTGTTTTAFEYIVVYDPSAGFVTGGGWINSLPGAYVPNPVLSGKATFGFVSKYQRGQNTPTGQTEFQLHFAGFRFNSRSYEWLVVAGAKAQYKGVGTVNGTGDYGFMLTATDSQINGGGNQDAFRIKIWDRVTGAIVYDNVLGAPDDLDDAAPQIVGGGSIVIHNR